MNTPHRSRVIVIANREPFSYEPLASGGVTLKRSTSGLIAASESLVRQSRGTWIAHASGAADRDAGGAYEPVPPGAPSYMLRRIWLDADERRGFYDRFCNEGLWPLCHDVRVAPAFGADDFDTYWSVNRKFAEAAIAESMGAPAVVLVQDYHFALAPLMLREELPDSAIVAFWHVPWPSARRLECCPWAMYLIEGLVGSHLLGFQTAEHCDRFMDAARQLLGADVDRRRGVISYLDRECHVRAFPASIDWNRTDWCLADAADPACDGVRSQFGLRTGDRLVVGVDRMDYTKGLEEKLLAYERFLERYPHRRGSTVLVQVAQPTRPGLAAYAELRARVRETAARVNARFATDGWLPVILIEQDQSGAEVARLLRAADVCYVGSLDDGMNLVAKEYVRARHDESGVLMLSTRAGAATELVHALQFDPTDADGAARCLEQALRMPEAEQQYRMRRMRARVRKWDASAWADGILENAARFCGAAALEPYRVACAG